MTRHDIKLNTKTIFTAPVSLWFFFRLQLEAQVSRTYLLTYLLFVCANRRRLMFGGVRRRRYAADRKAELPLIAAAGYSDMTLRTRRLGGNMHDDTGDESDCTATTTGDLRLYDCKRLLHCYQVVDRRS